MNHANNQQAFVSELFSSIDHITHINNLENILDFGLLPHNNPFQEVDISNTEVNDRRNKPEPIFGKNIHNYTPFYFNPRNAMLYRNQKEFGTEIIVLGFNNHLIFSDNAIFTDGNAACKDTTYSNDIDYLSHLDWVDIWSDSWWSGEVDHEVKRKMMAEILIYDGVNINDLEVIYCQTKKMKIYIRSILKQHGLEHVKVTKNANNIFFGI